MIAAAIRREVEAQTGAIDRITPLGGGCIAHASRVDAEKGTFFLKFAASEAGRTFEAEAAGLQALRTAAEETGLGVPRVLLARDGDSTPGLLLLEWITPGRASSGYWRRFGEALARLHRKAAPGGGAYGFSRDNFIGELPQENGWQNHWPTFFRERRLGPQIARARRSGHWSARCDRLADRLLKRLDELLPRQPHPSMLHGDLWSGNQLAGADGRAWLVDPAAYVGDRETDLAMTELFGGFGADFYEGYRCVWPLEPGYEERREIYALYHRLNHLNHFGAAYAAGVERTLARFGA